MGSTKRGFFLVGAMALVACDRACAPPSSSPSPSLSPSAATKVAASASAGEVEGGPPKAIPLLALDGPFPSIDDYCAAHTKAISKPGATPRRCKALASAGVTKDIETFSSVSIIDTARARGMAETRLLALETHSGFYVTTEPAWIHPLNGSSDEPLAPLRAVATEGLLVVSLAFEDVFGRDNGAVGGLLTKLESSTVCTIGDPPACAKPLPTARRSISVDTTPITAPPDAAEWDVHVTVRPVSRAAVRLVHDYGPLRDLGLEREPGVHPLTAPVARDR